MVLQQAGADRTLVARHGCGVWNIARLWQMASCMPAIAILRLVESLGLLEGDMSKFRFMGSCVVLAYKDVFRNKEGVEGVRRVCEQRT